ncbi:uncharacterized protein LOC111498071 [Cucurbita maxima]|uniref:Uncharacterized protein LOC111498071 n=1 Tax=Cucurbita maxima TaxID=3661 RepID=A0A6J1L0S6_CUCMA|nr:uncharacterized protein LOC111498071 [Cucurbita maxima]
MACFGVILSVLLTSRDPRERALSDREDGSGSGGSVGRWRDESVEPREAVDKSMRGEGVAEEEEMVLALRIAGVCASELPEDRPCSDELLHLHHHALSSHQPPNQRPSQCLRGPYEGTPLLKLNVNVPPYKHRAFPAEACDTVGGEACDVDMYPEVKLKPEAKRGGGVSEPVDREHLQYDRPKTVFPAEACDDLGW